VSVSKTSGAYIQLAENNADILLVYDGGDETREQVRANERFETVSIGKDALVFLVNRDNPVSNLTTEQVRMIFSGRYTNWSELGGSNEPIRAYQRGVGSGSQALMDKLVMPGLTMADPARVPVVGTMGGLIDAVADFTGGPTGIGYNVYFYVTEMRGNDYIKILSIDGVAPKYDTIQSGEYPFVSEFYSVIRKREPADSPARALHEWMLSDEAQNLLASENYVALHANPDADTPYVDGKFSLYPEGEAPEYLKGVDPFSFEARDDYGQLYFYLGATRSDEWSNPQFYGLCTADGKIVTEPIFTVPMLLTDSQGNKALFCYRGDGESFKDSDEVINWTYSSGHSPAMLFALDGSWVEKFDGASPFFAFVGTSYAIRNADVLAVLRSGGWGAVNMRGEIVVPLRMDGYGGIYPPADESIGGIAVTSDRFMRSVWDNESNDWSIGLYDGDGNLIAFGSFGYSEGMAGDFFINSGWSEEFGFSVSTYTLNGEPIANRDFARNSDNSSSYAGFLGDYVWIYAENGIIICNRELSTVYKHPYVKEVWRGRWRYDFTPGVNALHISDRETLFHRTYLPDGTRLVTWYDPEMGP